MTTTRFHCEQIGTILTNIPLHNYRIFVLIACFVMRKFVFFFVSEATRNDRVLCSVV